MDDDTSRLSSALADRYRIEHELGAGGMATVYLAEDLKHHRQVAIKVLKPELAAVLGADRFVREIETTASLQHPNILPLFDSGSAGGFLYYVMPYVEGETLRSKLDRENQLGVEEAVKLVGEVADALEYAHEHGVVHRDIKPENILLHAGRPMVADFGIALAVSVAAGERMTETGLSLGTPHYMSPEQATAEKHITNRSDIYSLGAVLYETLTGDPPHTGKTAQQIIVKIATEEPAPVARARKSVPASVAAAVSKALERLPADRFESARAFAEALENPAFQVTAGAVAGIAGMAGPTRHGWRARLRDPVVVTLALVAVAAIVTAGALAYRTPAAAKALPLIQFVLTTSDSVRPVGGAPPWPAAISPDGGTVVYEAVGADGQPRLYSLRTSELTARPIPKTVGADQPYFSPDGNWIGFEQNEQERKVRLDGGSPVTVVSGGTENNGATWTAGGQIVVGASARSPGLSQVSAGGGRLVALTRVDSAKGELAHVWPVATPDPHTVVFTLWYGSLQSSKLAAASLDDGHVTPLGVLGIRPLAVLEHHIIYVQADGAVMAVPFDLRHKRVTGPPVPVHDPVRVKAGFNGNSSIYVSRGGAMIAGRALSAEHLVWISRSGRVRPAVPGVHDYTWVSLAPDGRRIAAVLSDEHGSDVWLYSTAGATVSRLTTMGTVVSANWTHDGASVVFVALDSASHASAVWSQPATGGSPPRKLFTDPEQVGSASLAPDGESLVIQSGNASFSLFRVPLDSTPVARPYVATQFNAFTPQFSPDGKWVAYMSIETGQPEVYIRSFPDPSTKVQVSTGTGVAPEWSHDGSRLYYLANPAHTSVITAHVTFSPSLRVVGRDTLVSMTGPLVMNRGYGISPGGRRVLAIDPVPSRRQLIVSPNWVEELHRRLAGGGGGHQAP